MTDCDIGGVRSVDCSGDINSLLAVTRTGSRLPEECSCLTGKDSGPRGMVKVRLQGTFVIAHLESQGRFICHREPKTWFAANQKAPSVEEIKLPLV